MKNTIRELEKVNKELEEKIKRLEREKKRNKQKELSYSDLNISLFKKFFDGRSTLKDFPATNPTGKKDEGSRYLFIRAGKKSFRYSLFVSDIIEAWAKISDPKNGTSRHVMNRHQVIKTLQGQLTREPKKAHAP